MDPLHEAATKHALVEPIGAPADASGDRWVGRRIGNYVIDRPLARGGMASVYVARHPHLGREVAVKFMTDVSTAPELATRFLAEARVTASLAHPNIVEILDFGELDGALYYLMELLRGKSLRAVMREKGRFPAGDIVPYMQQICWALDAAHRAGIVHRDLKPANVLVLEGEAVQLKLLDFGVAKTMSSGPTQTRAGQVLGTATHMAPEQALGDPSLVTPQSDLYSLGAIAYEMLTGKPVFHHESDVMLMVMHVRDAVRPIREQAPDVPPAVAGLVEQCLAKKPSDRPAGARALAEALMRALRQHDASEVAATEPEPSGVLPLAERPTRVSSSTPPVQPPAAPARPQRTPEPAPHAEPIAPASATLASPLAPFAPVATPPQRIPAPGVPSATREQPRAGAARKPARATSPRADLAPLDAEATVKTLLSRLQRRGDFPAFGRTVGEVSHKADANGVFSAGQLGETILKDFALTAKLLRVVNATYAGRFGGKIYSIQHAIVILGFNRVRSLALSISLFKTSGTGQEPERVSESAISALVSSEIARTLAGNARVNEEEATVCAMFKKLGHHLVLVYLPELFDEIEALAEERAGGVTAAAKQMLGITFEDVGIAIARSWQLPDQVVNAMSNRELPEHLDRVEDRLTALANFSTELCDLVTREAPDAREQAVRNLLFKHKKLVGVDGEALAEILSEVESSLSERYATLLGSDIQSSRFIAHLHARRAEPAEVMIPAGKAPRLANVLPAARRERDSAAPVARVVKDDRAKPVKTEESGPDAMLAERLAEVKDAVERGQPPNGVLGLALRVLAELLPARSPLVLTATPDRQSLGVRAGLRDDLEGLKRALSFPLRAPGNRRQLFASAYNGGKDLLLKDCFDKEITEALPPSYFEVLGSAALAVYVCSARGVPPALVLVEADNAAGLPKAARVAALAELRPIIARAAAGQ